MKRTTIWLKSIQVRELKLLARKTEETVAGLIRVAIDEFLRRKATQKREEGPHGSM
jgi:predicted transcriptional regulator